MPDIEIIRRIAAATGTSSTWLYLGIGEQYGPGLADEEAEEIHKINKNLETTLPKLLASLKKGLEVVPLGHGRSIPVVGLVHAGQFSEACDGNFPPGIASDYVVTDRPGRCLFGVVCEGDSMEPRFQAGDVLVVNPELDPQVGNFVIIKIDGEVTFKKLVRLEPGLVQLKSLNPNYSDLVLTPDRQFRIIGRVVERKTLL